MNLTRRRLSAGTSSVEDDIYVHAAAAANPSWSFSTALFSRRLLSSNDHRKTTCLVIEATVSKDKVDGGAVEQK
jgi:hypothetical protein